MMRGPMRYRRLSYRYAMVVRPGRPGSFDDFRQTDRVRLLAEDCWHPDADTYETARTVEIMVDLAGVHEEDFEVVLFEDALVWFERAAEIRPAGNDEAILRWNRCARVLNGLSTSDREREHAHFEPTDSPPL